MPKTTPKTGTDEATIGSFSREDLSVTMLLRSDGPHSLHRVKTAEGEEINHFKSQRESSGAFAYDGKFGNFRYIYEINDPLSLTGDKRSVITVTAAYRSAEIVNTSVMDALSDQIIRLAADNKLDILVMRDQSLRDEVKRKILAHRL